MSSIIRKSFRSIVRNGVSICALISVSMVSHGGSLDLNIKTVEKSEALELTLFNSGLEDVLVSADLGVNVSLSGLREINFVITDLSGKQYYSRNEVRAAPSGETILLRSGYFLGRRISIASLVPIYGLIPGRYKLYAIYCQSGCDSEIEGIFQEATRSNEIVVELPEGLGDPEVIGVRYKIKK